MEQDALSDVVLNNFNVKKKQAYKNGGTVTARWINNGMKMNTRNEREEIKLRTFRCILETFHFCVNR